MSENLRSKLKVVLIILALIFLPPIGLYFALRKTNWKKSTKIAISIITALWTIFIIYAIMTAPPTLTMSNLKESGNAPTGSKSVLLKGEVSPADSKLTINGVAVEVKESGEYEYKAPLKEGDNNLRIVATSNDKVTVKTYKIHRYTAKEIAQQKAAEEKRKKQKADKKAGDAAKKAREKAAADKKAADAAAKAAADAQRKAAEEAARNQPKTSFGDGTFLVNKDIAPGTYRTSNTSGTCYYERLSGTSGTFDDIIANGNPDGQAIITIEPSDVAFKSSRCGNWAKI